MEGWWLWWLAACGLSGLYVQHFSRARFVLCPSPSVSQSLSSAWLGFCVSVLHIKAVVGGCQSDVHCNTAEVGTLGGRGRWPPWSLHSSTAPHRPRPSSTAPQLALVTSRDAPRSPASVCTHHGRSTQAYELGARPTRALSHGHCRRCSGRQRGSWRRSFSDAAAPFGTKEIARRAPPCSWLGFWALLIKWEKREGGDAEATGGMLPTLSGSACIFCSLSFPR